MLPNHVFMLVSYLDRLIFLVSASKTREDDSDSDNEAFLTLVYIGIVPMSQFALFSLKYLYATPYEV